MMTSTNFGFLEPVDPVLARYGALAEHYFDLEPKDCTAKLRQMAEYMAQLVSARIGLELTPQDKFVDVLRRLSESGALPREMADVFHAVRKVGNAATHEHETVITHGQALHMLKLTRLLAVWVRRTITGDEHFSAGASVPPEGCSPARGRRPSRCATELLGEGGCAGYARAERDQELAQVRDHWPPRSPKRGALSVRRGSREGLRSPRLVDERLRLREQTPSQPPVPRGLPPDRRPLRQRVGRCRNRGRRPRPRRGRHPPPHRPPAPGRGLGGRH